MAQNLLLSDKASVSSLSLSAMSLFFGHTFNYVVVQLQDQFLQTLCISVGFYICLYNATNIQNPTVPL